MKRFPLISAVSLIALATATGDIRTPSGNATVPNDAQIQPPQAFVDCMIEWRTVNYYAGNLSFAGKGITTCLPFLQSVYANAHEFSTVDLQGNAITDVDAVLEFLASCNFINDKIVNVSGGTNAVPTIAAAHQDGSWSFDVALSLHDDGNSVDVTYAYLSDHESEIAVSINSGITFAESAPEGTGILIGISDAPSAAAIKAKILSLWNATTMGVATNPSGNVISVSVTNDLHLSLHKNTSNVTVIAAGSPYLQNAAKTSLESNGVSVTTN